jgi:glutathione S-transferase
LEIIEFIGVVYRPTATLRYRLRELTNDYAKGKVSKEEINQFLQSWFAQLDHGDTLCGRQQMLADLYWFGLVKNFLRCVAL